MDCVFGSSLTGAKSKIVFKQKVNNNHFNLVASEEATWAGVVSVSKMQPVTVYASELVTVLFSWIKTFIVVTPPVKALWVVEELWVRCYFTSSDTKLCAFRDTDAIGKGQRLASIALETYCNMLRHTLKSWFS